MLRYLENIYAVIAICGLAISCAAYLVAREWRFYYCFRRAIKLRDNKDYEEALRLLVRAEQLWMLNATRQTKASHLQDCQRLASVLGLIAEVSFFTSSKIDTEEYRQSAEEMNRYFMTAGRSLKGWPVVYSKYLENRRRFRPTALRILGKDGKVSTSSKRSGSLRSSRP
jgi:hypothetical protein